MWVFGYGSLMWDGWHTEYGCLRSLLAVLPKHARAFNKASVRNWGTKANPGPTLNLVPAEEDCVGTAFEFPEDRAADVRAYLAKREGKGFELRAVAVKLSELNDVEAIVPFYEGRNLVKTKNLQELAALVKMASGRDGPCTSYVIGISDKLRALGINDPSVEALRHALQG
jgi:glutathione-specific gamma-glutamylcyclotransferase